MGNGQILIEKQKFIAWDPLPTRRQKIEITQARIPV